jgi:hypothetical protein
MHGTRILSEICFRQVGSICRCLSDLQVAWLVGGYGLLMWFLVENVSCYRGTRSCLLSWLDGFLYFEDKEVIAETVLRSLGL